jgi:endoglucanase
MKNNTRTTSRIGIALMLTIGLGIAGCGQQTAPAEIALNAVQPGSSLEVNGNLKAASIGVGAKGDWVGKWTGATTGRLLAPFSGIQIQGGTQVGTAIKYSLVHDGNAMIRTGKFGNFLTTAYLVRVPDTTKDRFQGWYANYDCTTGCKGALGYFEMQRDIKSNSIDGNAWYGKLDPKPMTPLVGSEYPLQAQAGFTAPGGRQAGTQIDYKVANGELRRSGTYQVNGRTFGTSAQLIEIPNTGDANNTNNHYIGWFANSDTSKLGFFVGKLRGGSTWGLYHEADITVPSAGGNWKTEANGFVKNSSVQYTINNDKDLFRIGAPAHLLYSRNGTETYMGWHASNGALNYFDASRGAFKGVSLAGLEFGVGKKTLDYPGALPGVVGQNYFEPTQAEVETYLARGLRSFRIPFRWERLQRETLVGPTNGTAQLDPTYFNLIDKQVKLGTDRGATVILDMHNYARYLRYNSENTINATGSSITSNDFKQVWGELARRYASNPRVVFGLMNEPFSTSSQWIYDAQEAAIQEIRKYASNMILISGNEFSGTWSWTTKLYNEFGELQPLNAGLFNSLAKNYSNVVIETHQYFDKKGQYERFQGVGDCVKEKLSTDVGNNTIFTPTTNTTEFVESVFAKTTQNLRENNLKGYLGEFGLFDSVACAGILNATLQYLENNSDVWVGWAYWAGGPKWGQLQKETSNYLESDGVFLPNDSRLNSLSTYAQK